MKVRFYARRCRYLWLMLLAMLGLLGYLYSIFPSQVLPDAVVLAAPRDLVVGPKDPYFISSIAEVWEPLINVDEQGKIVPGLATAWTPSEDYRRWTFTLREGVRFHDGTDFDADAVIANVKRWQTMKRRVSPFYTFAVEDIYPSLEEVANIDTHHVVFQFKDPQPMLIEHMVGFSSPIFSPHSFDSTSGDFTALPAGTGPFRLVSYSKNQYVQLERYDGYDGELAKEARIIIKTIPSTETRYAALRAEEIQGVLDLGAMSPALTLDLLQDERFGVSTNASRINQFLLVNQSQWPYTEPKVVQAISKLLDRQFLVKHYFTEQAIPTSNLINSLAFASLETPIVYDEEAALQDVLAFTGGKEIHSTLLIPQYGVNRYSYKEIAQYIQAQLGKANIQVRIVILDGAAHKKRLLQGDYQFSIGTNGLPNYDPLSMFQYYMTDTGRFNRLYHLGYTNPEAEAMLTNMSDITTKEGRYQAYQELQGLAFEKHPVIPLASDLTTVVYNKQQLQGYDATTYGVTLHKIQRRQP